MTSLESYARSITLVQLERLYGKIYERMEEKVRGGLTFGMDWPTIQHVEPGLTSNIQTVLNIVRERVRAGEYYPS